MDIEKLIELVRVHPVLYDTTHADYLRTKLKDQLWETFGAELETDGKSVKEQWRKLRENHREALRRQRKRRSDGAVCQKPWAFQSQMEFLLPFMKNRSTQSHFMDSFQSSTSCIVDDDDDTAGEDEILPFTSNEETRSDPIENEIPRQKEKNRDQQLLPQQFLQSSDKRAAIRDELRQPILEKRQPDYQNDALYQFFLSMYYTTKSLSPRYQRQVRDKIYEAVATAEEQNEISREESISVSHIPSQCSSVSRAPPPTTST